MMMKRPSIRITAQRLPYAALVAVMLFSAVAAPICAMPMCDREVIDQPAMEQHDCCAEPCDEPVAPTKGCGDACLLQSDETPAEVPGGAPQTHLVPLAWNHDVPVDATVLLAKPDAALDPGTNQRLASSTPLHVLISQYLI